jgi:hypothetical protein
MLYGRLFDLHTKHTVNDYLWIACFLAVMVFTYIQTLRLNSIFPRQKLVFAGEF